MAESGTTAAIILARAGSKGVTDKNLRKVGGLSLLARSIRAAHAANQVTHVWVSTDDARIADEAKRFGAHVIERPAELSSDGATSEAGWLHALPNIRVTTPNLSTLVMLQCTSPFTQGADIDGCIKAMQDQDADCALSVIADHSFLWHLTPEGHAAGTNHDETQQRQRRQDLPPSFRESGAIYVVDVAKFEASEQRFCGQVALHPVDHPAIEIDAPQDLVLANMLAQTIPQAPASQRLAAIRALVMDFDGVHTDDTVMTDQNGIESVSTSRGDGLGLSRLRATGRYKMLILSKEQNPVVQARAKKLAIEAKNAVDDKVAALNTWLAQHDLTLDQVLFIGNDINDLPVMRCVGLSAAPNDSHASVLAEADWVVPFPGGRGALRAICDTLLGEAL